MNGTVQTVQDTFLGLLATVLAFLPRLVNAAVLLIVGYLIAKLVRGVLTKGLRALHFDNVADRAGITRFLRMAGTNLDAARVLADVVFWWIFLVFIELALNALGLVEISGFLNAVLGYIPNVLAAVLVIVIGALLATVVADVVRGAAGEAGLSMASLLADLARWAIIIFVELAALTQLNVAPNMIFILVAGTVAMLALAGGLAFGLGGVDTARGLISGMAMGRMLQPGQRVRIGQEAGTVVRHDMNATIVDTEHGQISIPNSTLSSEHIEMLGADGMQPPRQPAGAR
jgi:Conserved TM helix/Mechanosensitive ion channel